MTSVNMNPQLFNTLPQNVQTVIRKSAESGQTVNAESLMNAIAEDGVNSEGEQALLKLLESSTDGLLSFEGADFEGSSVAFEPVNQEGLKEKLSERKNQVQRLDNGNTKNMGQRAKTFRQIKTVADLKRALEADQKLAGKNEGKRTTYNDGHVAGKMLLQDAVLLERTGLLSAEDKTTLLGFVEKIDAGHGIDALSSEDVMKLDQMVEKSLQTLEGQETELLQVDESALRSLQQIDDIGQRVAVVEDNYPALLESSQAAKHDLSNALNETGLSQYQLDGFKTAEKSKNWANNDVELGRSFYRISQSIDEVSKNIDLLENHSMPALEEKVGLLDQEIAAKAREIKPEFKTLDDAKVLQEVGADPILQHALGDQFAQKQKLMDEMVHLQKNLMGLHDSRIDGLKDLSSLRTIFSEKEDRVSSVNLMQSRLAQGSSKMVDLESKINQISVDAGVASEGLNQMAEVMKNLGYNGEQMAQKLMSKMGLPDLKALQSEVEGIRDNMIAGMDDLLKVYEESGTANDRATDLIQEQLKTLKSLKSDDPAAALNTLQKVRQNLVVDLKKMVPSTLALEEYHALTGLDKEISNFSNATHTTQTMGAVKQELIQEQLQEALSQKDNAAEKTTSMLSKFSDEVMAYDTHIGAEIKLLVGVGADVGAAEVFAGAGVTGSIYVGKKFGLAPSYRAMADLDFTAEVKAKIPHIVEFEAEYRSTIASAGVAFKSMDDAKAFLSEYSEMVATKAKLELTQLNPFAEEADVAALDQKYTALKSKVDQSIEKHSCSNDREQIKAKASLPGVDTLLEKMHLHGHGTKIKFEGERNTFSFKEDGENKQVQDNSWSVKGELNHYSFKFFNQDSAELDTAGKPTGHHKTRQGFHVGIPPEQVSKLLRSGAKLPNDVANMLAEKMLDAIGPTAGLTMGMVVGLVQNRWSEFTTNQAANLSRLQSSVGLGHGHSHAEFLIGLDWVMKDDKLQYVAVEGGYEKEFEKDFGTQIGTSPFRVEGQFKFDTEIALMHKIYKSDSYKAGSIQGKLDEKLPNMNTSQQLQYLAEHPGKAAEAGVADYLAGAIDAIQEKHPGLEGKSDEEVLLAILANPNLADETFIGYMLSSAAKSSGAH